MLQASQLALVERTVNQVTGAEAHRILAENAKLIPRGMWWGRYGQSLFNKRPVGLPPDRIGDLALLLLTCPRGLERSTPYPLPQSLEEYNCLKNSSLTNKFPVTVKGETVVNSIDHQVGLRGDERCQSSLQACDLIPCYGYLPPDGTIIKKRRVSPALGADWSPGVLQGRRQVERDREDKQSTPASSQ